MSPESELLKVARRVVWFKPPHETLRDEVFFLNHAMVFGDASDVVLIRRHYDDDALRKALREAQPGVFDPRSWSYWHTVLDISPPPALPIRHIPGADDSVAFRDGLSIRGRVVADPK